MNEIDSGRPRTPRDWARIGLPVRDRFGMIWWPFPGRTGGLRLICAPDAAAARKLVAAGEGPTYADVNRLCGPMAPAKDLPAAWM